VCSFEASRLWRESLGERSESERMTRAREQLRATFYQLRGRAKALAGEVARDLPEYTIHDIGHIDDLWETADLIVGPDYPALNPTEGFVLGCAFLIHDLGMTLNSYPGGVEDLKAKSTWRDAIVAELRREFGHPPTADEIGAPGPEIERRVIGSVLREEHARHARDLLTHRYQAGPGDDAYYLLENSDLRHAYGEYIGEIAASHGQSLDEVAGSLRDTVIGAPSGDYPADWEVNCLKLACIVRAADACQLAGRAPGFLRALRQPSGISRYHWVFQQNLLKPRTTLDHNRLVFTSGRSFPVEESQAWWFCFDALHMADDELRHADTTLLATDRTRFAARGIDKVEAAERLAERIRTTGWMPVDARIRVTDVAGLVYRLGGEQLYGRDPTVPLRELVQNASDAVRARRLREDRAEDWGEICVRTGADERGEWLEVADNGIGMTMAALTGPFLNFGESYWTSALMRQELPGLLAKGFQPTGKYGIGFFSVFIWGKRVWVTTRPYREAVSDTKVLEFNDGLASRPLVRRARDEEALVDGGTQIRVWLERGLRAEDGLLMRSRYNKIPLSLDKLCGYLFPSLPVNLDIEVEGEARRRVVGAADWIGMNGQALIERTMLDGFVQFPDDPDDMDALGTNLRLIRDTSGKIVGRACVYGSQEGYSHSTGVVTVGGIRACALSGIVGVLEGETETVTRDIAIPFAEDLAGWASEQADLVRRVISSPGRLNNCAVLIDNCGGGIGSLPIARAARGWLPIDAMAGWHEPPDEVHLVYVADINRNDNGEIADLDGNVLLIRNGRFAILWSDRGRSDYGRWIEQGVKHSDLWTPEGLIDGRRWVEGDQTGAFYSHDIGIAGLIIKALARAWETTPAEVIAVSDFRGLVGNYAPRPSVAVGASRITVDVTLRNPRNAHFEPAAGLATVEDGGNASSLKEGDPRAQSVTVVRAQFIASWDR